MAAHRLDVSRRRSIVSEGVPDLADADVERVVEVDEGGAVPQSPAQVVTGDELARPLEQREENLPRLILQPTTAIVLPEVAGHEVAAEFPEARQRRAYGWDHDGWAVEHNTNLSRDTVGVKLFTPRHL
jgi:hypothetical protein